MTTLIIFLGLLSAAQNNGCGVDDYIKWGQSCTVNQEHPEGDCINGRFMYREHFNYPFLHYTITTEFGTGHPGIDLATDEGTPIYAVYPGEVVTAGWLKGYGNSFIIQSREYRVLYGHMNLLFKHNGDRIEIGDVIGTVESTGHSTGPHLHLEIWKGETAIDPLHVLRKRPCY